MGMHNKKHFLNVKVEKNRETIWVREVAKIIFISIFIILFSRQSVAQEKQYLIDIPESQLNFALEALAHQTDHLLLFPYDLLKDSRTKGLKGRFTIKKALRKLFKGTSILGSINQDGIITVSLRKQKPKDKDMTKKGLLSTVSSLIIAGSSVSAMAQDEVAEVKETEEIIVTATKRATSLQDTALSISVFDGKMIERTGATEPVDFLGDIAGVSLADLGGGQRYVVMRGLSTTPVGFNSSGGPAVSTYIDEFPLTLGSFDVQTIDLERVEVMKGPQGTLYGVSALGGVVRYITNKPNTEKFEAGFDVELSGVKYGDDLTNKFSGYANFPLADNLAIRVAGYSNNIAGWIDNTITGTKDGNKEKNQGGRIAVLFEPTEDVSLNFTYIRQEYSTDIETGGAGNTAITDTYAIVDNGPAAPQTPTPFEELNFDNPSFSNPFDGSRANARDTFNLKLDVDLDFAAWSVLAAHNSNELHRHFDVAQFFGILDGSIFPVDAFEISKNYSLETRLVSQQEGPFEWIVGGWYQDTGLNFGNDGTSGVIPGNALSPFPAGLAIGDIENREDSSDLAFYGEAAYSFTDDLKLTFGYRHSKLKKSIEVLHARGFLDDPSTVGILESTEESIDTYKFNLEYSVSDDILVYASASSGYRSGGVNTQTFLRPRSTFETDTVWDYEVGVRSSWFDNALIANVTAYRIDWSDIQLNQFAPDFSYAFVSNAGTARVWGVESEFLIRPQSIEGLEFTFSHTYTDAKLTEDYAPSALIPPYGLEGARLPGSPRHAFKADVYYQTAVSGDWDVAFNVSYGYEGDRLNKFGGAAPDGFELFDPMPSYETVDASIRLLNEKGGFDVQLFVNNAFNETPILVQSFVGGMRAINVGRPKMYGIRVGFDF